MASLSEHSNVYNTALLILKRKGFQLWYDANTTDYCAERQGWSFRSPSPCGLLGLVAIFEERKPTGFAEYWWREEGAEIYRNLPTHPEQPYKPVSD